MKKTNKYNLFYVESPLQMLSAISAFKKFNQHKSILIANISHGDRINNDKQILQLINDDWDTVYIQTERRGPFEKMIGLLKILIYFNLRYKNKIDKYFIGEYRSFEMGLLNRIINPNEFILLDDGSFTITAQNYYIKNQILPYSTSIKYKIFKKLFRDLKIPNLYSFFKLDSTMMKDQINYYELPPTKYISTKKGEIYFFGSKFSESQNMRPDDEITILSKILNLFINYKVYYIPHRDESLLKLNLISKLGYKIKNLEKPAEIYFNETNEMPEIIISYYSTVLYSCHIKFKNVQIISIDIISMLLQNESIINAKEIYKYYENLGIKVIPTTAIEN